MYVVGIDYSMNCPAITVARRDKAFEFETCQLFYTSSKLPKAVLPNVHGAKLSTYKSNEERFHQLADWAIGCLQNCDPCRSWVYLEGYSMGSRGRVFEIAENTGLLKHRLWHAGFNIVLVPPTVNKRFATGKGNAQKDAMYEAFVQQTGVKLAKLYQPKGKKIGNPVSDLVDSFFLCQGGYSNSK